MNDFNKLIKFAKIIGIPITYQKGNGHDAALFIYDGKRSHIIMHSKRGARGEDESLILLHELGHAVDWIRQGRPNKVPKALGIKDKDKTRAQRFILWNFERRAVNNTLFIYNLLQLEMARGALETEKMQDLWTYSYFYRKGKYPTQKERNKKWQEFNKNSERLYK